MTVTLEVPVVFNAGDFWKKYPEDSSVSKTVGSWMTVTLEVSGRVQCR